MLDKLERKFGKYAIHNFSYYILVISVIGTVLGFISPSIYTNFLALDFDMILKGQVWRLFTFIFYPMITSLDFVSILFGTISLYFYYYIGTVLENTWGAFRFNVYYISGFLLNILSTLILYLVFGASFSFGMHYIHNAMFLAFATIMPDNQVRLYFLIPIKTKWLGYIYGAVLVWEIISNIATLTPGGIALGVSILVSVLNFVVYFVGLKKKKTTKTSKNFKKQMKKFESKKDFINIAAHTCCVCGRTNVTNPELTFRYCSKCEGEHEYCNEHIFTHEHIVDKNSKK
jgi:hypothetical protein